MKNLRILLIYFIFFSSLPYANAQSFLNLLGSDSRQSSYFEGRGKPTRKKVEDYLKQLQKLRLELRQSEVRRNKDLEKKNSRYLKLSTQYKSAPTLAGLRKDKDALKYHKQIVQLAEKNITSTQRLQGAYETREQHLQSLISRLESFLQNEKGVEKKLQDYYGGGQRYAALDKDHKKILAKLEKLKKDLKRTEVERAKKVKLDNANKDAIDKIRRALVQLSTQISTVPKDLKLKDEEDKDTTDAASKKPRRISRAERRRRRLAELAKKRALKKQQEIEQRKRERTEYVQKVKEISFRLRFEFFTMQALMSNLRIQDIDTDLDRLHLQMRVSGYIKQLMDKELEKIASRTKKGLWYQRSLPVNAAMFQDISDHTQTTLKKAPEQSKLIAEKVYKNIMAYGYLKGALIVVGILLLFIVLIFGARWIRKLLSGWMGRIKEQSKEDEETPFLWQTLLVTVEVLHAMLPYLSLIVLFPLIIWLLSLPPKWQSIVLTLIFMLPLLRGIWALTHRMFAKQQSERIVVTLNDKIASRFRRIIRLFAFFSFLYLPFLRAATLLEYPEPFIQLLSIIFYACMLICFLLLFINKEAILQFVPEQTSFTNSARVYANRFYSLISFAAITTFVSYAWGYINFAAYLVRGFLLTIALATIIVALQQMIWRVSKKLLGIKNKPTSAEKDEKEIFEEQRLWTDNLFRLIQIVSSIMLFLLTVTALFEVWQIGKGYRTAIQLLNTPLINVKDTQITILSLVKMIISLGGAIWLSGYLKRKFTEYLYPALQLSPSNQHASNTILGYVILILGVLFGLQWMGMGLGVLTVFAGVVGIGVGFGLQNIASNFISGLIITFSKPIKVDDLIEVGSYTGTVREISARSTTIMTPDSRLVLIPNADILTTQVINWSEGPPYIWASVNLGVAYGSDTALVKESLLEVAQAHRKVLRRPAPNVRFGNFGDSSLDFELRFAIHDPAARLDICSEMRFNIARVFQERGLEMPFPQRDLNLNPDLQESITELARSSARIQPAQSIVQVAKSILNPSKEEPTDDDLFGDIEESTRIRSKGAALDDALLGELENSAIFSDHQQRPATHDAPDKKAKEPATGEAQTDLTEDEASPAPSEKSQKEQTSLFPDLEAPFKK